jgi:outer membrane protein insertion porin family
VKFLKGTAEAQFVHTFSQLWPRTHFVLGARTGVLWTLEEDLRTRVTDRFHLGGPTDVRGFKHFGIGPKDASIPAPLFRQ